MKKDSFFSRLLKLNVFGVNVVGALWVVLIIAISICGWLYFYGLMAPYINKCDFPGCEAGKLIGRKYCREHQEIYDIYEKIKKEEDKAGKSAAQSQESSEEEGTGSGRRTNYHRAAGKVGSKSNAGQSNDGSGSGSKTSTAGKSYSSKDYDPYDVHDYGSSKSFADDKYDEFYDFEDEFEDEDDAYDAAEDYWDDNH
ncbi:hypothetical protein [Butyrivibrio sp. MC2013]|uniref:hypothetical protein n=1 Tax=Butyrivibrio sp. MC2013 TaxID=1280686 RepID=UPI0003F84B2B|nr:hypothetical protein [Butyrivibrio sp. MC2013]